MLQKIMNTFQVVLVTVLVPYSIVMFAVRLTLTPQYLNIAYRLPNMPSDSYGFSLNDRLLWSKIPLRFVTENINRSALRKLHLDNGARAFNSREIAHLEDVRFVVQKLTRYWYINVSLLIITGILYYFAGWWLAYKRGLRYGVWITIGIILFVVIISQLDFADFFADFHKVFFIGNTWLFPEDNTLIRLYPAAFWKNTMNAIGFLTLVYSFSALMLLEKLVSEK
jgi:integral membrane protein (TIGR01906 family)